MLLMGMAPLVWFSSGQVMSNIDLRFPPDVEHWHQFFFMWNETVGTGAGSILDPCLIFFQGVPAFFRWLGFPVWEAQMFSFTFWFLISSLSIYTLARKIFPEANPFGAPLVCVSSYLFNLWQEHIWAGTKPPLIVAYAILPWFIKLLLDGLDKEKGEGKGFLFIRIAVASFLLSAIGNNISEAYAVAFILILFSVYAICDSIKRGRLKSTTLFIFQAAIIFIIVNIYWIVPQVTEALKLADRYDPNQGNLMGFLEGTSKYTSFSNVIRFLGTWTWYEGVGEPYTPYATAYLENWFLITLSWTLPVLVLGGIVFGRFRFKGFFLLITIIAIWFGMGVHPPLGFIYEWMFKNIPFFWIVRSPYYKFMLMACIGYAVFLGAFAVYLENRLKNNSRLWVKIVVGMVLLNIVYGHIIVTGGIFISKEERVYLPPQRIAIPDYIPEAGNWLDSQPDKSRVFIFNEDRFWTTKWGFRGFAPYLINFTAQPIIFRYVPQAVLRTQGSPNQTSKITKIILRGIRTGQLPRADRLLSLMGARFYLLDKSLEFVQGGSYESIRKILEEQPGLQFARQFGNYNFFAVESNIPFAYTASELNLISQPGLELKPEDSSNLYPDFVGTAEESLFPLSQGDWSASTPMILVDQPENKDWGKWLQPEHIQSFISYNPKEKVKFKNPFNPKDLMHEQFVFFTKYMEPGGLDNPGSDSDKKTKGGVGLSFLKGFFKEEESDQGWIWMSQSNPKAEHIKLFNSSNKIVKSNFSFTGTTYGSERSLYFYLNSELKKVIPLKANEKKDIIIRELAIPPGENQISFYTPYSAENRNGKNVSFGFLRSSFVLGDLIFGGEINIPRKTTMQVQIVPMVSGQKGWHEDTSYAPSLKVNGQPIELKRVIDDQIFSLRGSIEMPPGENRFTIVQSKGVDTAIFFKPEELTPVIAQDQNTRFEKIDPTHYKISTSVSKPGFLIVSESYHPEWKLFSAKEQDSNKTFQHFKANGFANGFYLPEKGNYELDLVFEPQNLLITSRYTSILGLIAFFAIYFGFQLKKRASPRYS